MQIWKKLQKKNWNTKMNFISVQDYGAVGNGTADDTSAIQKAIDAAFDNGPGILMAPAGTYRIKHTLYLPACYGGIFFGAAATTVDTFAATVPMNSTRFVWDGDLERPMIRNPGNAIYLTGLSFVGCFAGSTNRARIGMLVSKIPGGPGGASATWGELSFINLNTGIQCGEASDDRNCSDIVATSLKFKNVQNAFHVVNTQGVLYNFKNVSASMVTDSIFRFDGGGDLKCELVSTSYCNRVLGITGPGSTVGDNTAYFMIDFVKHDGAQWGNYQGKKPAGLNSWPQLVYIKHQSSQNRRVIIGHVHNTATSIQLNQPQVDIHGNCHVEINGGSNFHINNSDITFARMHGVENYGCKLKVDSCQFAEINGGYVYFDGTANESSNCAFSFTNITDSKNMPIPDVEHRITF